MLKPIAEVITRWVRQVDLLDAGMQAVDDYERWK